MIRISGIRLKTDYTEIDIKKAAAGKLGLPLSVLKSVSIVKRSLDARKKRDIHYVITVDADVECSGENLKRILDSGFAAPAPEGRYILPARPPVPPSQRPYVTGSGPSGLFCAYFLAKCGLAPVLIERGGSVDERAASVRTFLCGGVLDPESNVQFGEGGAGTFSDGKLNYSGKDRTGRGRLVLETLVEHGGDNELLYDAKPHIGTDKLRQIVKSMRLEIIKNGGEVRFNTRLEGISAADGRLEGIYLKKKEETAVSFEPCSVLVLAPGHSARDTFVMLKGAGVRMEPKPFAVGIRVQHSQESINRAQYTPDYKEKYPGLPAADYKLVAHTESGRSVYSFCMCPGGYVINSSSEPEGLCINGMSYSGRSGKNANSAIVVNVNVSDYAREGDVLAGAKFQRELERRAFEACGGRIPVQRLEDFKAGKVSEAAGQVSCEFKGNYGFADINGVLPEFICSAIKEAFSGFGKRIEGFDDPDALISAVEARTSSPVRILRDDGLESSVKGIFPCGEGAGYAGGIMSAAMDGIKVFEEIYRRLCR